jgi:hypothetical protein
MLHSTIHLLAATLPANNSLLVGQGKTKDIIVKGLKFCQHTTGIPAIGKTYPSLL